MIQLRFELLLTDAGWVAQTHCDCGTTRTSDPEADPKAAVERCSEAFHEHAVDSMRAGTLTKCGVDNHRAIECRCDDCKAHNRKLAEMIGQGSKT